MQKTKIRSEVRGGKLVIDLTKFLSPYEGTEIEVSIQPYRRSRSQSQNEYYWGVVLKLISDHTGHSTEELHEFFKQKYLEKEFKFVIESSIPIYPSTKKLKTTEFEEYLSKIRQFASQEFSLYIPLPNEGILQI